MPAAGALTRADRRLRARRVMPGRRGRDVESAASLAGGDVLVWPTDTGGGRDAVFLARLWPAAPAPSGCILVRGRAANGCAERIGCMGLVGRVGDGVRR